MMKEVEVVGEALGGREGKGVGLSGEIGVGESKGREQDHGEDSTRLDL